ncbi:MAG: AI-2E family transporter [Bdellovibrionota bacterium]
MNSKSINRWFFLLALLPLLVLTAPFFIPSFLGVSMACVSMQLRDIGVRRLKLKRAWANVLVPTLLVFTFLLVIVFIVVSLSSVVRHIRNDVNFTEIVQKIKSSSLLERVRSSLEKVGASNVDQMGDDFQKDILANLTDPLKAALAQLPALFVGLFIFVMSFLGIYLNESKVKGFLIAQTIIPERYTRVLMHAFSEYSYSAFVAAGVTAIAQGAFIGIGAAASGAPSAFVFGVIGALSSLLPYVGTIPVSIVIALLLQVNGASTTQFVILLVFAILAGIIDNVLRPLIVKSRSDLHPWIAFISIFGGLVFWGLAGVFIGPVLAGMSIDLCKELLRKSDNDAAPVLVDSV